MTHDSPKVRSAERALKTKLASALAKAGKAIAHRLSLGKLAKAAEEDEDEAAHAVHAADWTPIAEESATVLADVAEDGGKRALLKLGIADDDSILEQTFAGARDWAQARAAELVGKSWDDDGNLVDNHDAEMAITDTIRDEVRAEVANAVDEGLSASDLADRIEALGCFSADRAELIARTEVLRANNAGHMQAFRSSGVVEQKAWSTAGEEVCDDCQENEGEGAIDLEDDFPSGDDAPPGHPNCLPGDALVATSSRISGTSERWYDGDLFVIRTASGKQLSCTPNHPILTHGRFVAARLLNVGDEVVSAREWVTVGQDDRHDVPSSIQDIAESFRRSGQVATRKVPLSTEDFHGDGGGSQVAVVRTDRLLRGRLNTAPTKRIGDTALHVAHMKPAPFDGRGSLGLLLDRMCAATRRLMRRLHLSDTLLLCHSGPLDGLRFALAAWLDAGPNDGATDCGPAHAESQRHANLRLSGQVEPNGASHIEVPPGTKSDPSPPEHTVDVPDIDPVLASQILRDHAGEVVADKVIHVERREFHGHVFNLQTDLGWYVANGIVTHNCRCVVVAVVSDDASGDEGEEDADDDTDDETPDDAAAE